MEKNDLEYFIKKVYEISGESAIETANDILEKFNLSINHDFNIHGDTKGHISEIFTELGNKYRLIFGSSFSKKFFDKYSQIFISIRGIFFRSIVSAIETFCGKEGIQKLESTLGYAFLFKNSNSYDFREFVSLEKAAAIVLKLNSDTSENADELLGKAVFRAFRRTRAGNLAFDNRANVLESLKMSLTGFFIDGRTYSNMTFEQIRGKKIKVVVKNDPLPSEFYSGIIKSCFALYGFKPRIELIKLLDDYYEFIIEY